MRDKMNRRNFRRSEQLNDGGLQCAVRPFEVSDVLSISQDAAIRWPAVVNGQGVRAELVDEFAELNGRNVEVPPEAVNVDERFSGSVFGNSDINEHVDIAIFRLVDCDDFAALSRVVGPHLPLAPVRERAGELFIDANRNDCRSNLWIATLAAVEALRTGYIVRFSIRDVDQRYEYLGRDTVYGLAGTADCPERTDQREDNR